MSFKKDSLSILVANEMENLVGARVFDRMREGGGSFIPFGWESYRAKVKSNTELTNKGNQVNTFVQRSALTMRDIPK